MFKFLPKELKKIEMGPRVVHFLALQSNAWRDQIVNHLRMLKP